jgi:hypothetical protein
MKLKALLTNYVMRSAVYATKKEVDRDYECGKARGIAMAITNLERLATITTQPVTNKK